jgi:glycosyltransferase involved in cell wall biosynthesis
MNNKPKIAVFIPSLAGGGAERAMVLFSLTLQELGHDISLVCAEKKGDLMPLLTPQLSVIDLHTPRMLTGILKLRQFLKSEQPDVVYATIIHANLGLILAAVGLKNRPRLILREATAPLSGSKSTLAQRISYFLLPYLYRHADKIIAVSGVVRDELISLSPRLAAKIEVLDTPVIPANFATQAAAEPGHPWFAVGQPPVILGVGRLQPQKNFALLIKAFAEVRAQRASHLIILGQGALQAELESLAESLGLADQVSFAGFALNPFSYMSRSRVFVLSSNYEGMPNVLIQALALATPVVATDCPGGSAECLEGGRLGYLTAMGDQAAITTAILAALDSPRRADAAEIVSKKFGAAQATKAYLACAGVGTISEAVSGCLVSDDKPDTTAQI